ncbi:orotidine-5'-phosphate decarboxylase [Virgibacillus sp. MG-45]|uniref:orotidine-5'-phosphate decarboxylase n=1 Tax=Virgibacillus sp. MG-45 TaxID=3102791 RepID=UPI002ED8DCAD
MRGSMYLALDFPSWEESKHFLKVHRLQQVPVKIGMELFYREGPSVVEKLIAENYPVFLDLKLHDIPNTVKQAMMNLARLNMDIVNVHALGGAKMIEQAKEGLLQGNPNGKTKLIAVTILTSMDEGVVKNELHLQGGMKAEAVHLAKLAKNNGADGVVCSVHEAKQIKAACGEGFLTVTPGIRLAQSHQHDQIRIATPAYAKKQQADILVIGRSITKALDPHQAYQQALKEWNNGE